VQDELSVKRKS